MHQTQDWKGRIALVTGATSGIGRALTTTLAREGLRVAFCGRRSARLQELETTLASAGFNSLGIRADLRDTDDIKEMFSVIHHRWGPVEILVNNAGMGRRSSLMTMDRETWREILDVNVLALATCTALAIADMRAGGDRGHIVNVSSIGAHRHKSGDVGNGMYVASKHAVRSLTESLRIELREAGSGIRVSSISPGLVQTEFAEVFDGDSTRAREIYSRFQPLDPKDIAEAILFLLAQPQHSEIHDLIIRPTRQKD